MRKNRVNRTFQTRRCRLAVTTFCLLLAVAASVLACGWDIGTDHSVRFNPYRTEKEFGRLPPLPKYASEHQKKLFAWDDEVGRESYDRPEKKSESIDKLWQKASEAEGGGRLGDTRRLLKEYLERTEEQRYARWDSPKEVQKRRNTAIDKLDALGELDHGTSEAAVAEYLAARAEYDGPNRPDEALTHLEHARHDVRLRDNADYLEAALRRHGDEQAVREFERVAAKYPHSEKREAALFMAALLTMKSSQAYQYEHDMRALKDPCNDCRDESWRRAGAGFKRVMREYPHGRYYSDARGWLAYLSLLIGNKAGALVEYYRMLGDQDEAGRVEALFSLSLVRHEADDSDMEQVEATLASEPSAALAYAYHNIYNYVFRSVYLRYWNDDKEEEGAEREQRELKRTASFATRMMNRYPASSVGAGFVVRVAEADLELGKDSDAAKLARRAVGMGAKGDIRAEALWVAGAAEFREHQYSTSRQALTTLVSENPNNRYTEGARRQLAILAEDTGDIEGALDQYLALDYRHDTAYFIDVLMTPAQLTTFIENRPSLPNRDELLYALGVRYLRDRRWNDARNTFSKVKTTGRDADKQFLSKFNEEPWRANRRSETSKEQEFDPSIRGIRPQWIDQDLRTANDIERLEHEVDSAKSDEARAEALYQVASYQFERSLLFYNPLEWQGDRHYLLVDLDERGNFRQANESQVLFDYMQKHDMAANSLPIFLDVVRRFPGTRAAQDALFTAGVCHERLHEYNNYWRAVYAYGGHAADQMVTYSDVRATYPSYKLPRGTFGWEPATRTVNGGPGWAKPPKPRPRASRWARAALLANSWVSESIKFLNRALTDVEYVLKQCWCAIVDAVGWFAHWLWILAMIGWLWFLWRRASEARALMDEALSRCKPRPAEEEGNAHMMMEANGVSMVLNSYLGHDLRDRCLEAGRDVAYRLRQIGAEREGRALVAFYAATHGLFFGLLVRLMLNW